jgi:hypothetical protein
MTRADFAPDLNATQGRASNVIDLQQRRDDDACHGLPHGAACSSRPLRPRSPEVQAKLDRLKGRYGFDPDADSKLSLQDKLDRMERNQIESGFDIDAWRAQVIADRIRILAELGPEPAPVAMLDADITKLLLASSYPAPRAAGHSGRWRRVKANTIKRDDSHDDSDDAPSSGQRLPFHPAAEKFPLMNDAELKALAEDIKAHGLNEDIETLDGMVLDGRNRYNACLMIRFDLTNRIHALSDNTDPVNHLVSKNLMRRHLTKLERALFAARMVTVGHGGDRKSGSSRQNDGLIFITAADAACRIGVSQIAVERAGFILSHCVDEVIAAIDAGIDWLSLGFAHKLAHSSDEDQRLWLKDNKHVIKPVKRAARPPRTPIPFTVGQLKGLTDQQSLVVFEVLKPKINRALKPKRIVIIDPTEPQSDKKEPDP